MKRNFGEPSYDPEGARELKESSGALDEIDKRIVELKNLIGAKRKEFYSARPESLDELTVVSEEVREFEELKDLSQKREFLTGGLLGAD